MYLEHQWKKYMQTSKRNKKYKTDIVWTDKIIINKCSSIYNSYKRNKSGINTNQ